MSLFLQQVVDAISLGGLYALVALGIALIFGVMGFINFAHGELIMIGAYVFFYMSTQSPIVALLAVLFAVALAAVATERIAFRPIRGADPMTLLITSFAVSFFLQNLAFLTVGAIPKFVDLSAVSGSISLGGVIVTKIAIIQIIVSGVLLVGLWAFLTRTAMGIAMRASAEDFEMARFLGVRANRVIAVAFAISGLLAGSVSILFVAQVAVVTPTIGLAPALIGFVATVLGGMRSLVGAALADLLLGVISVALQTFLPGDLVSFRDAFIFAGVLAVLVFRPGGLLGSDEVRI